MHGHRVSRPVPGEAPMDEGFTFVEVLVAVVILGIAFTAILGGMATSIRTSDAHRQQAEVQAVLASAVDRVKSPANTRIRCDQSTNPNLKAWYDAIADGAAPTADANNKAWPASSITVTSVTYSDGNGGFGTTCYDTAVLAVPVTGGTTGETRRLMGLQLITIEVVHPDGRARDTMSFIKGVG